MYTVQCTYSGIEGVYSIDYLYPWVQLRPPSLYRRRTLYSSSARIVWTPRRSLMISHRHTRRRSAVSCRTQSIDIQVNTIRPEVREDTNICLEGIININDFKHIDFVKNNKLSFFKTEIRKRSLYLRRRYLITLALVVKTLHSMIKILKIINYLLDKH